MLKKQYFISLIWLLPFLALNRLQAESETITVIVSRATPAYSKLVEGFSRSATFHYNLIQLDATSETPQALRQRLKHTTMNMVVAIGNDAAELVKPLCLPSPVVYALLTSPDTHPDKNESQIIITPNGTRQLLKIHELLPHVRRVGVIYNPQYTRNELQQARWNAGRLGLMLLPIAIEQRQELPSALDKFRHGTVDAVWMLPDPSIIDAVTFQKFSIHCEYEKIPLVGLSKFHVSSGALLSFCADYEDVGVQTALHVQKQLTTAHYGEIESPRKILVYVNPEVLKRLNLTLPPEAQNIVWVTP